LTISKKNLKNVLKSAERYRAAIVEFERVKALHAAADPATWVERHQTIEILVGGAKFEREHLAEAEAAIAKWQGEIDRLEGVVAAEKAAAKAKQVAAKRAKQAVKN
jgi:valyl-tRNA synthetase